MTGLVDACLNHRLLNLVLVRGLCVRACACARTQQARIHMRAPGDIGGARVRADSRGLTTCSSLMSDKAGLLQKSNTSLV